MMDRDARDSIQQSAKKLADMMARPETGDKFVTGRVTGYGDDGRAWVMLDGASASVPCEPQVEAGQGDKVTVRMSNGRAELSGNSSDPSAGKRYVDASVENVQTIADEANAAASAIGQHFFSDDAGVHVTDVTRATWDSANEQAVGGNLPNEDSIPYHNILVNSLGLLLRHALKNLVSITRSAIAFFDGNGNASSNVVASFGSNGAVIGKASSTHVTVDNDSLDIEDGSSNVLATFGASGAQIGKSNSTHVDIDADSFDVVDSSGVVSSTFGSSTARIGKNSSTHVIIDSDSLDIADGSSNVLATFQANGLTLGSANQQSYFRILTEWQNPSNATYMYLTKNRQSQIYATQHPDSNTLDIFNQSSSSTVGSIDLTNYNEVSSGVFKKASIRLEDGTIHAIGPISLGTNTEAEENGIRVKGGGTRNAWLLRNISAANGDGDAVLLGNGGMTIVGGGESANSLWTELGLGAGTERLYLASDTSVYVTPNCQTAANRYTWEFNTAGDLQSPSGGAYVANNGQFYADSDDITSGTHPSSETAGKGVIFRDSGNAIIGVIQPRFGTSTQAWQALRLYSQRKIGTADKYNILDLRIDDDGNQVVYTNNAAAWRSALGLGAAATRADSYFLKRQPASTSELPQCSATSNVFPIVLGNSFANDGTINYMTAANFRTAIDLQQQDDYYAASSATQVNVANTSLYRFLVILFRTNSATYTGGGASAATSPLNSTVVHINKKSSGSVYVSLMGAHALSGTSVQIRTGLATITCSATAGKVVLSNSRYINLGNGSSGTQEVGSQADMALVGVIGVY